MTGEILHALEFAAAKHRDQRRKDAAASPYINHPLAVVKLLWDHGVDRRKQLHIEHGPHLSTHAKLVKLADKTANLTDMNDSPPHKWTPERRAEYYVWAHRVVAGIRGTNAGLEAAFDAQYARRAIT